MADFEKFSKSERSARTEMETAAKSGTEKKDFQKELYERTGDEKFAKTYKTRGRLYDNIHLSLRTMDIIIVVTCVLIVAAIVVGVLIGQ